MNKENVQKAIDIMRRAGKVDMGEWQEGIGPFCPYFDRRIATTEAEAQECGTAACFAGWVALSPEFQKDGGKVAIDGAPVYQYVNGYKAIALWLEIECIEAAELCFVGYHKLPEYNNKESHEITSENVISVLERLLKTGSVLDVE